MPKSYSILALLLSISLVGNAQQTVGVFLNDSLAYNGYTLFTANSEYSTYLIDNCGQVVNQWAHTSPPGLSSYLLENGNLLRTTRISNDVFSGGGSGGRIELFDWDNNLLWRYDHSDSTKYQHHDIEPLPNGNILILAWEYHSYAEALAAGRVPSGSFNALWTTQIIEVEPIGTQDVNIVWEWHLWDHLVQNYDSTKLNYGIVSDHPELIDLNFNGFTAGSSDWQHCNAVDYNPELDQIIINSRNSSEFWIIDHSTTSVEAASHTGGNSGKGGDILYRWGNPQTYGRGTVNDQILFRQHDARWIPPGSPDEGKIIVYNNGLGRPTGNASSIEVVDPIVDAQGNYTDPGNNAHWPPDAFWTYPDALTSSFFSSNISGAQRLPNGNTLICEGAKGHLFEVDRDGNLHWDYIIPVTPSGPISQGSMVFNNSAFRTHRYSLDYPAFIGKDMTPGDVIELNPYPSTCSIYDPTTSLEEIGWAKELLFPSTLRTDLLPLINPDGQELQFEIFDVMGRRLLAETISGTHHHIRLPHITRGIYFIRFTRQGKQGFLTKKFIKQ